MFCVEYRYVIPGEFRASHAVVGRPGRADHPCKQIDVFGIAGQTVAPITAHYAAYPDRLVSNERRPMTFNVVDENLNVVFSKTVVPHGGVATLTGVRLTTAENYHLQASPVGTTDPWLDLVLLLPVA